MAEAAEGVTSPAAKVLEIALGQLENWPNGFRSGANRQARPERDGHRPCAEAADAAPRVTATATSGGRDRCQDRLQFGAILGRERQQRQTRDTGRLAEDLEP